MKSYDSQIFFLLYLLYFITIFIPTLFPNVKGAQVRFGYHLTGGQWESWANRQLSPMSSLQIPSCGCLTPGLHQALYKNNISFLLPLLMPEQLIQAVLALSRGRVSWISLRGSPWALFQGCVTGASVCQKEALHHTLEEANPHLSAMQVGKADQPSEVFLITTKDLESRQQGIAMMVFMAFSHSSAESKLPLSLVLLGVAGVCVCVCVSVCVWS